jgi:transcriptional regulator with XRE-family HTH domain
MMTDIPVAAGRDLLAEFLKTSSAYASQKHFAEAIGCSESHLSLILSGKRSPSMRLSKRIADETGGLVPMASLVPAEDVEAAE